MLDYNGLEDPWMNRMYDTGDPYKGMSEDERHRLGCLHGFGLIAFYIISFVIIVFFAAMCQGCTTTKYVEVEKVRTDTTYITKHERDSIFMHDSVHVKEKGDTVLIERWHTKYVEKLRIDTTYISKTDSIPVPYPVEKKVPAELSWWQKTRIHVGSVVILAAFVLLFWKFCLPLLRKFIFKH